VKEKLVSLVPFFEKEQNRIETIHIQYVQKQIEMNTNKVIMTKFYSVSYHHLCHHPCHQLLLCWYNNSFHVKQMTSVDCSFID